MRQYLSDFRFRRKVACNGRITLLANNYSAGRQHTGRYIELRFDPLTDHWVMQDECGQEFRRHPAKELTYEQFSQLKLAKRRRN